MTIAFTKDASVDIDSNPAGESATFTFSSPTDVKVRYTLRDVDGRPPHGEGHRLPGIHVDPHF